MVNVKMSGIYLITKSVLSAKVVYVLDALSIWSNIGHILYILYVKFKSNYALVTIGQMGQG